MSRGTDTPLLRTATAPTPRLLPRFPRENQLCSRINLVDGLGNGTPTLGLAWSDAPPRAPTRARDLLSFSRLSPSAWAIRSSHLGQGHPASPHPWAVQAGADLMWEMGARVRQEVTSPCTCARTTRQWPVGKNDRVLLLFCTTKSIFVRKSGQKYF